MHVTFFLRVNALLRRFVYQSRFVTRLLFGCSPARFSNVSYWELATLAMRKALRVSLHDGMRVLELGCGPYAILSLWAASRWRLEIEAVDIDEQCVEWARDCVASSDHKIPVHQGDMFSCVEGPFDVIWFVAPFTPREVFETWLRLKKLKDPQEVRFHERRACGGDHGLELLTRFFNEAGTYLRDGGRVLVSLNAAVQNDQTLRQIMTQCGWTVLQTVRLRVAPYCVLVASRTPIETHTPASR